MEKDQEKYLVELSLSDPKAFQKLYDYFFPKIYAYVSYRVDRVEDVEDLVAETFVRLVSNLESFKWRGSGSFAAWLFRIAHNLVSNFYRQHNQNGKYVSLDNIPDLKTSDLMPEDVMLQKEKFIFLKNLISTLSIRRQEVIILKFFGGLRNYEIAEILELDERTVASHLCRGLNDLHHSYIEQFVQPNKEAIYEQNK